MTNMRNNVFNWIKLSSFIFALSALFASCSNELDETLQPASNGTLQFVVSDFPMFGEGTQTRVIGTQDEGKTVWANEDKILVHMYSQKYGDQAVTLTFDAENNSWESDDLTLSYLENETPSITAVYAPDCEIKSDKTIGLLEGKQYGEAEYIPAKTTISGNSLVINFEGGRDYSRLRIAGLANQTLTVTTTGFTPAGANNTSPESGEVPQAEGSVTYTLTTDNNGNAFLYGTFAVGATVSVTQGDVTFASYTFTADKNPGGTEHNKSYALDAMSPYIYDEATNTYTVYTAEGLYAWSEKVRDIFAAGVFNSAIDAYEYKEDFPNLTLAADIILTGENNWTPIGGKGEDGSLDYTGTVTGCFTGDAATIKDKVSEMNAAIDAYNANEANTVKCPYIWQTGTDDYPTLVKSE